MNIKIGDIVSWKFPETPRENQIHRSLKSNDWIVIGIMDSVICLKGQKGVLIEKNGYERWVPISQVVNLSKE